ncbi:HAD-IC family P-type ATPase [Telmatospirillum siberiense]|uniref:Divalent cation transporter n=1 Tax=Telmatospirillum siberiense TaxID=382514 RepID=A0A2N3PQ01_9PROT|nr:HAD-IC family P-type ATPase [Telmatospirillum siberiense]PKU22485.1 divalent cation transporter [Telmatospirillum siberiense]
MNTTTSDSLTGLTGDEAGRRLATDGTNAVPDVAQHPINRALQKLWAPVPWMLEVAVFLQLVLGEYVEASAIAFLLIFNAGLGFFQEGRAQATLKALKSRLAITASVRRDGIWKTIPAVELVRGDVVKLSLGAVVPADVRLLTGAVLIDQSTLTGESAPVEAGPGFETYAGALIRRGEAAAEILVTGSRTKFGRSAELIRAAHVESTEQKAVFRVVSYLALFNGGVTVLLIAYAVYLSMPFAQIAPLVLVAVLASIPVALPSMFTLAATVGARAVARRGVLPTRLSALDEAAGMDVLCADKTGTLTRNELAVTACNALPGFDASQIMAMAAMASSDGGSDPLDGAIRAASQPAGMAHWKLVAFTPFDPARKMSEAAAIDAEGRPMRIVKGALAAVATITEPSIPATAMVEDLQAKGFRVLVVAVGPAEPLRIAGVIALSDPPREDSAALITQLHDLGVRTVMVTGDSSVTARVVADAVGITGPICATVPLPHDIGAKDFGVFAGVLPADKYALVQAFQRGGHVVGMCGDGANDAPALRQAQMGIAVLTATDVAKSAAGIVLTEQGLGGVVAAVQEGRTTFQRILTYTFRSIIHKVVQVLLLLAGLVISGTAVLTPLLMVLMMVAGDFFALSSATDNVRPSPTPNVWRIGNLTIAGIILGFCDLIFCTASLAVGRFVLGLDSDRLRTLTVITLVYSGQAIFYVSRERRHLWSSRPGSWLIASSILDITLFGTLATQGVLMAPLPAVIVTCVFGAAIVLAFCLDAVKILLFRRLAIS